MRFRPERNEAARCWIVEDGNLSNYLPLNEDRELVIGSGEDSVHIQLDRQDPPDLPMYLNEDSEPILDCVQRAAATMIKPRDSHKNPFFVLSRRANGYITILVRAKVLEVIGTSAKILVSRQAEETEEALVYLPGIVKITDDSRILYLTAIRTGPSKYEGPKLHTVEAYEKYRDRLLKKRGLDLEKFY